MRQQGRRVNAGIGRRMRQGGTRRACMYSGAGGARRAKHALKSQRKSIEICDIERMNLINDVRVNAKYVF